MGHVLLLTHVIVLRVGVVTTAALQFARSHVSTMETVPTPIFAHVSGDGAAMIALLLFVPKNVTMEVSVWPQILANAGSGKMIGETVVQVVECQYFKSPTEILR